MQGFTPRPVNQKGTQGEEASRNNQQQSAAASKEGGANV